MPAAPADKRPKNRLLITFRKYHGWFGAGLAVFFIIVCITGLYLNHKDLFEGKHEKPMAAAAPKPPLTAASDLASLKISHQQALALAARHWGADAALEHIQLKSEHGSLVYKIKTPREPGPERELIVDAATGDALLRDKSGYQQRHLAAEDAAARSSIDWGRLMNDLHTGKFFGGWIGKLLVDLTSITLLALTLSGVYLWWIPIYRKQKSAKTAAAAPVRPVHPAAKPA